MEQQQQYSSSTGPLITSNYYAEARFLFCDAKV